jgi:hypothetical protein
MTDIVGWLDERGTAVPPRLTARLGEALGARVEVSENEATSVCVDAAEALLRDLLARETSGRDVALDLLTVDALATYAFEAAAANPATLKQYATAAAARFAAVANANT